MEPKQEVMNNPKLIIATLRERTKDAAAAIRNESDPNLLADKIDALEFVLFEAIMDAGLESLLQKEDAKKLERERPVTMQLFDMIFEGFGYDAQCFETK